MSRHFLSYSDFLYLFSFIIGAALPGIGVFGFYGESGILKYWLRPASSDLNAALGLALIAMIAWAYLTIKIAGAKFFVWELFGNKASKKDTPSLIYMLLTPIFILVGVIEVVSIAFRPRFLYLSACTVTYLVGKTYYDMTGLVPYLLPVPFYFYEILVGVAGIDFYIINCHLYRIDNKSWRGTLNDRLFIM